MSPRSDRRTFLKTAVAATSGASLLRMPAPFAAAAPSEAKWSSLFDDNSLDGWHKNPNKIGHGTSGIWRVEDGAIVREQDPLGSGNGGILLNDEKFGDFELMIDMKPDWVCSGLFLRGNDSGQCFQMMVDFHNTGNVGHLHGEGTTGFNTRTFDINGEYDDAKNLVGISTANHKPASDAGLIHSCTPEEWIAAWKVNDWNAAKVRVEGKCPKITTWINGLKVCEFDGINATTERSDKEGIAEKLGTEGSIVVQVHGGTGWPKGAKCRRKNIKARAL
ncbi:MAG TPA: DUF1080 domain-containing protein [Pirellulaceae bacterium]|nr:DUF1080 domain-containing protein [Planctomycetales bacterium]HRX79130.1 DUF1080 domain-containing protein [Pirellulaceae bacterium]